MTSSLNLQGSDSSSFRGRSKRRMGSRRITAGQEKFLRKLLLVLSEIVDEKGQFDDDYNKPEASGSGDIRDEGEAAKDAAPGAELKSPTSDGEVPFEAPNLKRFAVLCEELHQLIRQIQASLNALGGGSRTAEALEMMRISLNKSIQSYHFPLGVKLSAQIPSFYGMLVKKLADVTACIRGPENFCGAVEEVIASFKELGVFNTRFFYTLKIVEQAMKTVSRRLDREYNFRDLKSPFETRSCYIDAYLDSVFSNLNESLDALIPELMKVLEKDIATVRLTQDFSSQRYLNLTTISTFLSSVTATTLQITANGPSSILSTATNSLWLISLVFSTASAVYSLLIMTWRQSAVRPPDLCLPSFARVWLRNGPMFALIAALGTFSIGLCFLAFMVADQRSSVAPAALPVAFAGFHAYAICVLSAWFLFERWKTRNTKAWEKVQHTWLMPAYASARNAITRIRRCNPGTRRMLVSLRRLFGTSRQLSGNFAIRWSLGDDVERAVPGHYPSEINIPTSAIDNVESQKASTVEDLSFGNEPQQIDHHEDESHASPEATEWAVAGNLTRQSDVLNESRLFNRTLQFSADCILLASAFSNAVTIYDVERSFATLTTIKVPRGHTVEQVAWEPRDFNRGIGALLVRTSVGISVHEIHGRRHKGATCFGQLEATAKSACWVREEDTGLDGFSCLIDDSLKVLDRTCKELASWDLSRASNTGNILDATLFQGKYILCLERVRENADWDTKLLVISRDDGSLLIRREVKYDQLLLAVSHASVCILMLGGETGEVNWPRDSAYFHDMGKPVKALTFCGKADSLIMGYSEGEIFVWDHNETMPFLEKIHAIRTADSRALVQDPVAAAVGVNTVNTYPYLFAFGAADGTVKIWSVLSNDDLRRNESAETFKLRDEREGWKRTDLTGRFLVLPPPNLDIAQEQVPGSSQERC